MLMRSPSIATSPVKGGPAGAVDDGSVADHQIVRHGSLLAVSPVLCAGESVADRNLS
jgi:hypothetical protein